MQQMASRVTKWELQKWMASTTQMLMGQNPEAQMLMLMGQKPEAQMLMGQHAQQTIPVPTRKLKWRMPC